MSSNVNFILRKITRGIPKGILDLAFLRRHPLGGIPESVEFRIRREIIDNWVLPDCDFKAGVEKVISISGLPMTTIDGRMLVTIPYKKTFGRSITSVLSISDGYSTTDGGVNGLAEVIAGLLPMNIPSSNDVVLEGNNTISIPDGYSFGNPHIRCILTNDAGFANISPRSMNVVAELCVLATKAYIYNHLVLHVAENAIINGIPVSKFAEILDRYADMDELYEETFKLKWTKVAAQQDPVTRRKHINMIMPR